VGGDLCDDRSIGLLPYWFPSPVLPLSSPLRTSPRRLRLARPPFARLPSANKVAWHT